MKEKMKLFLVIMISVVISSTISITANTMLQANSISYKTSNGETVDVKSALDRLFDAADINGRLGNTDISSIGDGTITGAINGLNNSLSNSLTYNEETDSFGIEYNGKWHEILLAGLQFNGNLYDNGSYPNTDYFKHSISLVQATYNPVAAPLVENTKNIQLATASSTSGYMNTTIRFNTPLNLRKWKSLDLSFIGSSGGNGGGYAYIGVSKNANLSSFDTSAMDAYKAFPATSTSLSSTSLDLTNIETEDNEYIYIMIQNRYTLTVNAYCYLYLYELSLS